MPIGAEHGQQIVCLGKGHEDPTLDTGDLILTVKENPHAVFKRQGINLFITKHISLLHALTGFAFDITHLDDRKIRIASTPGQVTGTSVQVIRGEGMPNGSGSGDLYIEFVVDFPDSISLTEHDRTNLGRMLGGTMIKLDDNDVTPVAVSLDIEKVAWQQQERDRVRKVKSVDDEDDEREGQPQCQTQ